MSLRAILIDLSGTLHVGKEPVHNACHALERLRSSGIRIKFVTNTTKDCKSSLVKQLRSMGFSIDAEELHTSLNAASRYLHNNSLRPMLLVDDNALPDFEGIIQTDPNAVVIGLAPDKFDYRQMNQAFRLIKGGAPLIAVHKGRYQAVKDGLDLGPGPFVAALEYATGANAHVCGKPNPYFFQSAVDSIFPNESDINPSSILMVGDDIKDDVNGAQASGYLGCLVKTGKYLEGDESSTGIAPNFVCDSFPTLVDFLFQNGFV